MGDSMHKRLVTIFQLILYLIAGGICGGFGEYFLFNEIHSVEINVFIILIFFYFSIIMQIIIHEIGHLIFGLATGYRFQSIRFFNFMLIRKKDGIHFKRHSLIGTAGQCLLSPPNNENDYPFQLYHYGGVLMNLITSFLFLLICILSINPYIKTFSLCLICMGIITAIMNGIPMHTEIDNDATNIKNMKKNQQAKKAAYQQLKISEYISLDYRLKDIDNHLLTLYNDTDLNYHLCVTINVQVALKKCDEHKYKEAKNIAEYTLNHASHIMDIHKYILNSIILYHDLINDPSSPHIGEIRDKEYMKYVKATRKDISTLRCEYAYALLYLHDKKQAQKLLESIYKLAKNYPYNGEIISEYEHIQEIQKISYSIINH